MRCRVMLICLLLALAANCVTSIQAQINIKDSLALVDLYRSTNGLEWRHHDNWLTAKPAGTWYGITVTGSSVTAIDLSYNYLRNRLPFSIGNLTQLQSLNLHYNGLLAGSIPYTIGKLTKLSYLNLAETYLGGSIPSSLGNLVNLQYLYLYRSQFSDSIPAAIGKLVHLKEIDISENNFSGNFPSSIGNLINLRTLYASQCNLTGSLPASIGNLTSLQILSLGYNRLTGPVPTSIGNLSNLTFLAIFHNQLSGSIPSAIGNLSALTYLDLNTNHLAGEVPAAIFNLKRLSYINLEINELTESENIHVPIPDVIHKTIAIRINNNKFTFNGIESIRNRFPFWVQYAPQDTIIPIQQHGNVLSLSAGGTPGNNTYYWYRTGSKNSITITGDSIFHPAQSGKYYAYIKNSMAKYLTLTTDTITYTAPLWQGEDLFVSAAVMKRINSKSSVHPNSTHFSISPNPAGNIIHLQTNGEADIALTNSSGKVLLTKSISNKGELNISHVAAGLYYIQNKTSGEVQKIVVAH